MGFARPPPVRVRSALGGTLRRPVLTCTRALQAAELCHELQTAANVGPLETYVFALDRAGGCNGHLLTVAPQAGDSPGAKVGGPARYGGHRDDRGLASPAPEGSQQPAGGRAVTLGEYLETYRSR